VVVVLPLTRPSTHTHNPGGCRSLAVPVIRIRQTVMIRFVETSSLRIVPLRCSLHFGHRFLDVDTLMLTFRFDRQQSSALSLQPPSSSTMIETTPSFFVCFRLCSFVPTML
jgi:hypothetical protein